MLKATNKGAVPRVTKPLVLKIMSRVGERLGNISSGHDGCLSWTGEINYGTPSILIDGQRYRVQLLLHCWYERRKAYPRRCRYKRVSHCFDRHCVNPHHIVPDSLPRDPVFADPIPITPRVEKKISTPPSQSDEMSTSMTISEDCTSISEDTCDSMCDG